MSFAYQPYGVTLNFTPVVLSQGRIQLRVATEVTDIDNSKADHRAGTFDPGVPHPTERDDGRTSLGRLDRLGRAHLDRNAAGDQRRARADEPADPRRLFRSRDYQRQETELLIIVTPYIVHAIDPHEVVKPDANYVDASDPQSWLLGRVNRLYSTAGNPQAFPNYSGKVGFIND